MCLAILIILENIISLIFSSIYQCKLCRSDHQSRVIKDSCKKMIKIFAQFLSIYILERHSRSPKLYNKKCPTLFQRVASIHSRSIKDLHDMSNINFLVYPSLRTEKYKDRTSYVIVELLNNSYKPVDRLWIIEKTRTPV